MENQEALSEWEWNFIKHQDPVIVRKRFREELDYLGTIGGFLDIITNDSVLAHILAYAWRYTYRLALVCKRFWIVTKTRHYWTELAKHALKDFVPAWVLNQVNFFYFHKKTDPPHMMLQSLFKNPPAIVRKNSDTIEFFYPKQRGGGGVRESFDISWIDGQDYSLFMGNSTEDSLITHTPQTRVWFGGCQLKKIVWNNTKKGNGARVSIFHYCEIYDPNTGLTWYGQPGTMECGIYELPKVEKLLPGPHSFGVWK